MENATVLEGNSARKKKKQNEKPKLNMNPKMLSQKGAGEYFRDSALTENPPSKESPEGQSFKLIPGLFVDGQKPLKLNLDLSELEPPQIRPRSQPAEGRPERAGGDGQPQPRPVSSNTDSPAGNDMFFSEDEFEEEEEEEEKTVSDQCFSWSKEMMALMLENNHLILKMRAERRLYQGYQEELMRENQKLRYDLEEKESQRMEIIEELRKMIVRKMSSEETDGKEGRGK